MILLTYIFIPWPAHLQSEDQSSPGLKVALKSHLPISRCRKHYLELCTHTQTLFYLTENQIRGLRPHATQGPLQALSVYGASPRCLVPTHYLIGLTLSKLWRHTEHADYRFLFSLSGFYLLSLPSTSTWRELLKKHLSFFFFHKESEFIYSSEVTRNGRGHNRAK